MNLSYKPIPHLSRQSLLQYLVLCGRVWLGFILCSYGVAKLSGFQFYISEELLSQQVKYAHLFKLSWFLAEHQPFKTFVGVSQIITGLLLLFDKTAIIGLFISIPLWFNILIWDWTFMSGVMLQMFIFRISFYIILTCCLLWVYRKQIFGAVKVLSQNFNIRIKRSIILYILLPVVGYCFEYLIGKAINVSGNLFHLIISS